ncbi:MAG: hypothetical protein ABEJ92_02270 [Halobacteriales archaeon]
MEPPLDAGMEQDVGHLKEALQLHELLPGRLLALVGASSDIGNEPGTDESPVGDCWPELSAIDVPFVDHRLETDADRLVAHVDPEVGGQPVGDLGDGQEGSSSPGSKSNVCSIPGL